LLVTLLMNLSASPCEAAFVLSWLWTSMPASTSAKGMPFYTHSQNCQGYFKKIFC
jgi:hypothetical protein